MPMQSIRPKCLSENEPLSRHSSFKIGGMGKFFARPLNVQGLQETLEFAASEDLSWVVVGGGCNTLFQDDGFSGIVIKMDQMNPLSKEFKANKEFLTVPAGLAIPQVGRICKDLELGGLEFLSQIPGTIGGAVVMNAGFSRLGDRSQCTGAFVKEVSVLTKKGLVEILPREKLLFTYRKSDLKHYIVLDVTFALKHSARDSIEKAMKLNYEYRMSVQDLRYPSVGSVFKNPDITPLSVGQMIDRLGLKGKRIGDAQISERHGNWICNTAHARSCDVLSLVELMRTEVLMYFGVDLELEMKVIGRE